MGLLLVTLPTSEVIAWGPTVRISTNTGDSRLPSVASSGSYAYVAWQDDTPVSGSGGQLEIWMRVSPNNGGTFGSAIRISTDTGASRSPSVTALGKTVYVAWDDWTHVPSSGTQPEIWLRVGS